jgi:hypothetical protein
MKRISVFCIALIAVVAAAVLGQDRREDRRRDPFGGEDVKLPSGKSQRDEIIKADHKKSVEDATQLARLAGEVREDLENSDSFVVSLKTLKKLDEIETLTRGIRGRLKRM